MGYLDRDAAREVLRKVFPTSADKFVEPLLDALEGCVRPVESIVPEKTFRDMTWRGRQYREISIDGGAVKQLYVMVNGQWVNAIGFLPEEDEGIWQHQDTTTRS